MPRIVYLDFETASPRNLKEEGLQAYVSEAVCDLVGIAVDGGDVVCENPSHVPVPVVEPDDVFVSHNISFERAIWRSVLTPKYYWPPLPPIQQWRCTMAKCAAVALPHKLDDAGMFLLGRGKYAKHVLYKYIRKGWAGLSLEDQGLMVDYNRMDVDLCRELDRRIPNQTDSERAIWEVDQGINERGYPVDADLAQEVYRRIVDAKDELSVRCQQITGGIEPTQTNKLYNWLKWQGFKGEGLAEQNLIQGDYPPEVNEVIWIRYLVSRTSTKKLEKMAMLSRHTGRCHEQYVYGGASVTMRWTARDTQPQNMPRTDRAAVDSAKAILDTGNNIQVLSEAKPFIRGSVVPAGGKKFMRADWKAIEARVLAWMVGSTKHLNMYRNNEDTYKDMACRIYQKPDINSITYEERFMGKQCVLGLGYGQGAKGFRSNLESQEVMPRTSGGTGSPTEPHDSPEDLAQCLRNTSFAQRCVNAFREEYASVVAFWAICENAFSRAYSQPYQNEQIFDGKITYRHEENRRLILAALPSGRQMLYHRVGLQGRNLIYKPFKNTEYPKKLWYGLLVENLAQAIARDILAYALVELDRHGYQVVMHTHDDIVVEGEGLTQADVEKMRDIMLCKPPHNQSPMASWIGDLPLDVDGPHLTDSLI